MHAAVKEPLISPHHTPSLGKTDRASAGRGPASEAGTRRGCSPSLEGGEGTASAPKPACTRDLHLGS